MALGPIARSTVLRALSLLGAALLFAGGGWLWTRGHHGDVLPVEATQAHARSVTAVSADAPLVAPENIRSARPELSDAEREKRRFERLDADGNASITQAEYLSTRRKSFDRLDTNGDGKVSFEEYSARAVKKFAEADGNGDGNLSVAEFATTAPKHRAKPKVNCPPAEVERPEPES